MPSVHHIRPHPYFLPAVGSFFRVIFLMFLRTQLTAVVRTTSLVSCPLSVASCPRPPSLASYPLSHVFCPLPPVPFLSSLITVPFPCPLAPIPCLLSLVTCPLFLVPCSLSPVLRPSPSNPCPLSLSLVNYLVISVHVFNR